jgi:hypothetical protein
MSWAPNRETGRLIVTAVCLYVFTQLPAQVMPPAFNSVKADSRARFGVKRAQLQIDSGPFGGIMTRGLKFGLLILILLLLVSVPLAMQFETGSIEGVITNERGPIAKASVEARNVMSGAAFRTESDAVGHYRLENLRAGRYSLWVGAPGHDSMWIRQVIVERGQTAHSDIHLGRSHTTTSGL